MSEVHFIVENISDELTMEQRSRLMVVKIVFTILVRMCFFLKKVNPVFILCFSSFYSFVHPHCVYVSVTYGVHFSKQNDNFASRTML